MATVEAIESMDVAILCDHAMLALSSALMQKIFLYSWKDGRVLVCTSSCHDHRFVITVMVFCFFTPSRCGKHQSELGPTVLLQVYKDMECDLKVWQFIGA